MHVLNSPEGRGSGVYRWGNPPGALANQGITLAMWNTPPLGEMPAAGTSIRNPCREGVSPERISMVFVVSNTGERLMPTSEYRARKLLKSGRAVIHRRKPFAIRILDRSSGEVQPVEYTTDVGYLHVGVTVKSEKHSFFEMQADLLKDEKEHHNDRKKYRCTRRNRKRYRKPRFDNRRREKGWLAPSIRHKVDAQLRLFRDILEVCPVSEAWFEMGKFDTQLLKAIAEGNPAPEGTDYQHGERYAMETLRAAAFARDGHACVFCGRGIKDGAYLHVHHIGYWKKDRSNRLSNLASCCELCHTPANHQPVGILYGAEPKLKSMAAATFMTMIRWQMYGKAKEMFDNTHITYGARTKIAREDLNLEKSHVNDAYCIGKFRPKHRTGQIHIQKVRRNDRILQKFYDAEYIDGRDGKKKKGKDLTNGRINRNHKKDSENLHRYRAQKIRKGYFTVRRSRTELKPGSVVRYNGEILEVHGTHTKYRKNKSGKRVKSVNVEFAAPAANGQKSASLKKCVIINMHYNTGWEPAGA